MNLIPTWPIAVGTLVLGLALGAGGAVTIKNAKIDRLNATRTKEIAGWQAANAKALETQRTIEQRNRHTEQEMAESFGRTLQAKENENQRIALERDVAIAGLRDRPARRADTPKSAGAVAADCKGATGAELSREDGEFLVGEAARANVLREELSACYALYDEARARVNRQATPAD